MPNRWAGEFYEMNMDATDITTAAIVIGAVVAYFGVIFLPVVCTPHDSPHKRTVTTLCAISLICPVLWIVALVFASIRTDRK